MNKQKYSEKAMPLSSFILASASPRRLKLLADIGIVPDKVVAANLSETMLRTEKPKQFSERMALEKLEIIARAEGLGAYILAADTVVAVGSRVLPKAKMPQDVCACLKLMSGRRHRVYTAVAIRAPEGQTAHRVSASVVAFHNLSEEEIKAYAACGEGIGKAGGYAIQGRAGALIRYISGSYSGVVGLPLFETAQMLRGMGWRL